MLATRLSRGRRAAAPIALSLAVSAAFACSSSSSTGSSGSSGAPDDGGGGGSEAAAPNDSGGGDAGAVANAEVNGCKLGKNYVDHTGASDPRKLTWDFSIAQSPDRCMTILAGQSVTWVSSGGGAPDLATHPMNASGGDTPNPVSSIDPSTGKVTFAKKGVFGFQADIPAMTGAVQVQ